MPKTDTPKNEMMIDQEQLFSLNIIFSFFDNKTLAALRLVNHFVKKQTDAAWTHPGKFLKLLNQLSPAAAKKITICYRMTPAWCALKAKHADHRPMTPTEILCFALMTEENITSVNNQQLTNALKTYREQNKLAPPLAKSFAIIMAAIYCRKRTLICLLREKSETSLINLAGIDLKGAYLCWADLKGANLRGADLSEAKMTRTNLSWANLTNANLTDTFLGGAILIGTNFQDANLKGTYLSSIRPRVEHLFYRDPIYSMLGANLTRANLRGANLEQANLSKAKLQETQFLDIIYPLKASLDKIQTHLPLKKKEFCKAIAEDIVTQLKTCERDKQLSLLKTAISHSIFQPETPLSQFADRLFKLKNSSTRVLLAYRKLLKNDIKSQPASTSNSSFSLS